MNDDKVILNVDGLGTGKPYRIVDAGGDEITPAHARELWTTGRVQRYNLAFMRLAEQFDFDLHKLRAYYARFGGA